METYFQFDKVSYIFITLLGNTIFGYFGCATSKSPISRSNSYLWISSLWYSLCVTHIWECSYIVKPKIWKHLWNIGKWEVSGSHCSVSCHEVSTAAINFCLSLRKTVQRTYEIMKLSKYTVRHYSLKIKGAFGSFGTKFWGQV